MSESRENLLQGLNYVRTMLVNMQNVLTEYINLEGSFRSKQAATGTTSVKDRSKLLGITAAVTLGAFYLLICLMCEDFTSIVLLAAAAGGIASNVDRIRKKLE